MKITTLSISLLAGFFCFKAAAGCLSNTGVVVSVMELGFNCPSAGAKIYIMDDGDQCELVPTGDWICAVDAYGKAFGGPYRYTGYALNEPEEPEDPDSSPVITQPEPVSVPSDLPISNALTQFSYKMSAALGTLGTNQFNLRAQANYDKSDIMQRMGEYNTQSFDRDMSTRASIDSLRALTVTSFDAVETNLEEKFTENKELHEKTHAAQDLAQESLNKLPQLEISVENARYHAQNAHSVADSANYNAQRAYEAASEAAYYSGYVTGDIADTKSIVSEIRNILLDGDGDGGDSGDPIDLTQTNQLLSDLKNDANNSAFVTQNSLIAVNDRLDGLLGQGQGLSQQLGQQLNQIKTAVENSGGTGGGTGDDDTETNEKLDGISGTLDTIAESLSGTIPDGTGSADNVAFPDYQEKVDDGYTQIMEKVNGQVEGMDKITGITTGLTAYESLPEFFRMAQSSCSPIAFGPQELDLCGYTPTIRTVLTWVFYMLTALFMITHFHKTIQNMRL